MMFSTPILTLTTWRDQNKSTIFSLEMMSLHDQDTASFNVTFDSYVEMHKGINTPLVQLSAYDKSWSKENFDITVLRSAEFELASVADSDQFAAIFDLRAFTRFDSGLSIARTIFICFVLAGGALLFSNDTNKLVIIPIEKMIDKVTSIAKNPLEAA